MHYPKYQTVKWMTEVYGCGRTTVFSLLRQNKIESVKLGTRRLISVASIDSYFRSLSNGGDVG